MRVEKGLQDLVLQGVGLGRDAVRQPRPVEGDGELAHDAGGARRQHVDAVREADRLAHVMGHEQRGPAAGLPALLEPALHLDPGEGVERAEGLVEQHHAPLLHDGPEERRALAHAAGELRRIVPLETGEAELREERSDAGAGRTPRHALHLEPEGHVVDDPPPGHQRVALRHEGEGPVAAVELASVERDLAPVGNELAEHQPEEGRLAGAGGAEDRDELAGLHVERDAGEHLRVTEPQRDVAERKQAHRWASSRRHGIDRRWRSAAPAKSASVRAALTRTAASTRSGRKLFFAFRM